MTQIHVVTLRNYLLYKDQLSQYFRLRHQVFVEERRWEDLRRPDGVERDAYDNPNTVYLLALEGGRVIGGQRLYPTLLPDTMSDVFPAFADAGVPRSASILECTRYFVVKERRTGRTDCLLLAAMQEYCLDEGIAAIRVMVEMWWLPRWQQVGCKLRPLGLPVLVGNEPCMTAIMEISQESLDRVREVAGLRGSSLCREGGEAPGYDREPHVAA
jgi:acyl-homoserine lactone synthase